MRWNRPFRIASFAALALGLSVCVAQAFPSYWNSYCAGCHTDDSPSCNGCHQHRGSLSATKDKTQYDPGELVTITLNGGSQYGWVRGLLYDQDNVEIARRSGPSGTGDDGGAGDVVFPVVMQAPAPAAPGTYAWKAAWFGHPNNGGSAHEEQRVTVNITVVQNPADAPEHDEDATFVERTWSRIKESFGR